MTVVVRARSVEPLSVEIELDGTVLSASSPLLVEIDRRPYTALLGGTPTVTDSSVTVAGTLEGTALSVQWSARLIAGQPVWECGLELRNDGSQPVTITRMDPFVIALDGTGAALSEAIVGTEAVPGAGGAHWKTTSYRSAWGDEFRPEYGSTRHDLFLGVRSGRSGHGADPWLGLEAEAGGAALIISPAWSGNWHIDALAGGHISAGLSPWQFSLELAPGESVTAPSVVLAVAHSLESASTAIQEAVRDEWLPRTAFTDSLPVEWNHWWPYEDAEVTEDIIFANATKAAELGIQIATVDAGWFGAADAASDWQEQRGDWSSVNTERFPSGLVALGEGIRSAGVHAGMWIEAEAVGRSARLRQEHPELLARAVDGRRHDPSYRLMTVSLDPDDPTFLGYVCLGSAAGRSHVLESMSSLIRQTGARWIKLDFNIDPDAGCTRTDHGHGAGDGLFRHYEGLYSVLGELRQRHPEIVLESCSSGGLRIDLGLARQVHCFFLSDPDYTEHHLEVLFGVSGMIPPLGILHWSWSQWRGDYPPSQLDWASLSEHRFDSMLRAAMVHRFGVSLRLIELRPQLLERLREHVAVYREKIAPIVRSGVLIPLTDTPQRGGLGERAPSIQLAGIDQHVVATFVLSGGERPNAVVPRRISPEQRYRVTDVASGLAETVSGALLISRGIPLAGEDGVESWLHMLEAVGD